jgi:DNA-binding Xre family transcriptional regulator
MMKWRLKELQGEYLSKQGVPLTYEQITADTGLSSNTLSTIATKKAQRADLGTLDTLLSYFERQLNRALTTGELLEYVSNRSSVLEDNDQVQILESEVTEPAPTTTAAPAAPKRSVADSRLRYGRGHRARSGQPPRGTAGKAGGRRGAGGRGAPAGARRAAGGVAGAGAEQRLVIGA